MRSRLRLEQTAGFAGILVLHEIAMSERKVLLLQDVGYRLVCIPMAHSAGLCGSGCLPRTRYAPKEQ